MNEIRRGGAGGKPASGSHGPARPRPKAPSPIWPQRLGRLRRPQPSCFRWRHARVAQGAPGVPGPQRDRRPRAQNWPNSAQGPSTSAPQDTRGSIPGFRIPSEEEVTQHGRQSRSQERQDSPCWSRRARKKAARPLLRMCRRVPAPDVKRRDVSSD